MGGSVNALYIDSVWLQCNAVVNCNPAPTPGLAGECGDLVGQRPGESRQNVSRYAGTLLYFVPHLMGGDLCGGIGGRLGVV